MSRLTRPFSLRWVSRVAAVAGVAVLLAPVAQAAAAPEDAIAGAAYGQAEIWLQRKSSDREQRELVYRPRADAAPQVLDVTVPQRETAFASRRSEQVALGLDRTGQLAAIVTSRTGLYWTRVDERPKLHHVPGTTKHDAYASVFHGRLALSHAVQGRASIKIGSLTRGTSRTVSTFGPNDQWSPQNTVIGAGGAVAWINVADGAEAALYNAVVAPAHKPVIDVWPRGDHHEPVSLSLSRDGRRLTVHGRAVVHYALPSGRRLP